VVAKGIDEMTRTNFDTQAILIHASHFDPEAFNRRSLTSSTKNSGWPDF